MKDSGEGIYPEKIYKWRAGKRSLAAGEAEGSQLPLETPTLIVQLLVCTHSRMPLTGSLLPHQPRLTSHSLISILWRPIYLRLSCAWGSFRPPLIASNQLLQLPGRDSRIAGMQSGD